MLPGSQPRLQVQASNHGGKWIKWWNMVECLQLGAVMAVMILPPIAASFLLVPPRILVKWPFQLQLLDGWLKCWAQMLGQQQRLARYGQTKVPIFYHILDISETAKHFAHAKKCFVNEQSGMVCTVPPCSPFAFCVYWLAMLLQALSMLSNSSSVCEARKDATQRRKTCQLWNVFYWQANNFF